MQLPDLDGKTVLITGANTGIGAVTAKKLAAAGAEVFIAGRSRERTQPVLDAIAAAGGEVHFLPLDLGDLDSVRACADAFLETGKPLHLLINNAGLAGARGRTKSGFELGFGVNHVGHFLLTTLLLDRVRQSAPARIVTVASRAHYRAGGIDPELVRRSTPSLTALPEYGVSKLANVLFSAELARRLEGSGVTTYSLHPGVVATDVWRSVPAIVRPLIKLFMLSEEAGAETTLHCATNPEAGQESGLYYDGKRPRTPSRLARDEALAAKLWAWSEDWVKP